MTHIGLKPLGKKYLHEVKSLYQCKDSHTQSHTHNHTSMNCHLCEDVHEDSRAWVLAMGTSLPKSNSIYVVSQLVTITTLAGYHNAIT